MRLSIALGYAEAAWLSGTGVPHLPRVLRRWRYRWRYRRAAIKLNPKRPATVICPRMGFEDTFPFRERPAAERYEHERAPSGDVAPRREQRGDAPPSGFEGRRAVYRLAFKGMEVPGLPGEFRIGGARISLGPGPLATQRTTIVQTPGVRPVFVGGCGARG
jgi:hypothetical protein